MSSLKDNKTCTPLKQYLNYHTIAGLSVLFSIFSNLPFPPVQILAREKGPIPFGMALRESPSRF